MTLYRRLFQASVIVPASQCRLLVMESGSDKPTTAAQGPCSSLPAPPTSTITEDVAVHSHDATKSNPGTKNEGRSRLWPSWIPTSEDKLLAAEDRLLSFVKARHVRERVPVGPLSAPEGASHKSRSLRNIPPGQRLINTVRFEHNDSKAATMVLIHGFGGAQGFFFRNFDYLSQHFRLFAMDMLGWGASSRPSFYCKTREESEAWHVESLEEWRKAEGIESMIIVAHSFGAYVAALYSFKYPERVRHLILIGPAGWSWPDTRLDEFRSTFVGSIIDFGQSRNCTPQFLIRSAGPLGRRLVARYIAMRFRAHSVGEAVTEEEGEPLTDYLYHTMAAPPSGELCLKHIFDFGPSPAAPLNARASEFTVPVTFIYGEHDWMDYRAGIKGCHLLPVPSQVILVPKGGHFVFLDNPAGLNAAIMDTCKNYLPNLLGDSSKLPSAVEDSFRIICNNIK